MNKQFLTLSAVFGALAVISGALLAHQLKQIMPAQALEIYETAVRYQFYHVFALMAAGILSERFPSSAITRAGYCFIGGILLFSGSLYGIAALKTRGMDIPVVLGIITPLGGLLFISGWLFLARSVWIGRRS